MDFLSLLWIFFIISSLQPVIRQKMLEVARLRMLQQLERQRKSRVILLIHRQETMSFLGFPIVRYIDIEDSEAVLRAIKLTDDSVSIDLILHTPGGLVLAAEQIAQALRKHPAKVTVHVPHYAMSGGTLIALAAASILTVLERKDINQVDDSTIILADVAEKAIRQVTATVTELLHERMGAERARQIATTLASGVWTHDYPISVCEARNLGLPVSTDMPKEVYQLMNLYPQTAQRRPSVEYIPAPYRLPAERRERQPAQAEGK